MKKEKNYRVLTYGLSLAASWAWGVSLIVGMETVQTKGIIPFSIWAIANSLALPLFGVLAFGIPHLSEVVDTKIIQVFTTCIMVFCFWIQMNAIHDKLKILELSEFQCKAITISIALILVICLYKDGLLRNILLDKTLWCICYLVLFIMLVYAQFAGVDKFNLVKVSAQEDMVWAWNTVLILFAGPIMNIQNWQMAHKLKDEQVLIQSHIVAGVFFGIYMILVFLLAHYKFDSLLLSIQVIAILCITITTMDAAVVGMQRIGGIKIGTVIAMVSIISWQFVIPMGVLNLWTFMGNRRKEVAFICIIIAMGRYVYQDILKKGKKYA